MTRKFKTSKKKRTNYIYYGKDSSKTVLIPGEDGVTEAIIETLHSLDYEEVDNDRRETRRHSSFDDLNDKAETIADPDGDVEDRILSNLEWERAKTAVDEAISTLKPKEQSIIKWLYLSDKPLTQAEVGKRLDMTEDSVKKSAFRIRAKLKEFSKAKFNSFILSTSLRSRGLYMRGKNHEEGEVIKMLRHQVVINVSDAKGK